MTTFLQSETIPLYWFLLKLYRTKKLFITIISNLKHFHGLRETFKKKKTILFKVTFEELFNIRTCAQETAMTIPGLFLSIFLCRMNGKD